MTTNRNPQTLETWLELLETRHPKAIDLGLERCREVWVRMGTPRPAPSVYVVADTNGKGSTVATICSVLGALGHRHGSYTTPHLYRYNERVQLSGRPVSDKNLLDAFDAVESARGGTSLTYFEFGTLAALWILSRADLDYAVMEVGLGGRLDAVNLVDADCAVITAIGLDHQDYLGPDLLSIGREKAGIIRPSTPVICGEADPPASVLETAASLAAPVKRLGREFRAEPIADGVDFTLGETHLALPRPALAGPHQVANMATGLAAVLELLPDAAADLPAVRRGLRSVSLAGRFERVSGQPPVWIDVGHNPMAAQAVGRALAEAEPGRRIRCVLGMLSDKDAAAGDVIALDSKVSVDGNAFRVSEFLYAPGTGHLVAGVEELSIPALDRVLPELGVPLAEELLFGKLEKGGVVRVKLEDRKLAFEYLEPPQADPGPRKRRTKTKQPAPTR